MMSNKLNEIISTHLRSLRKEKGWSLDVTAANTGVSKAMLGQIERGESSPTIATLWKIVTGFSVSFSSFITDHGVTGDILEETRSEFVESDKVELKTLFAYSPETGIETFKLSFSPGHEQLSPAHQKGVIEHVVVIEGLVEILFDDHWHPLKKGESIRFDASHDHGYANRTKNLAQVINIICYPRI